MPNTLPAKYFVSRALTFVRRRTALMTFCSALGQLAEGVSALILATLIERITSADSYEATKLLAVLILAWIAAAIFPIVYQALDAYVSPSMFRSVQEDLFGRLMKQSAAYFENKSAGELSQHVRQAAAATTTLHNIVFFEITRTIVILSLAEFLLFPRYPLVALAFLLWVIIYVLLSFQLSRTCLGKVQMQAQAGGHSVGRLIDVISNLELVHLHQGHKAEEAGLATTLSIETSSQSRLRTHLTGMNLFQAGSKLVVSIGVGIFAYTLVRAGQMSVGEFVMLLQLSLLVALQIQSVSNRLVEGFNQLGILAYALEAIPDPIDRVPRQLKQDRSMTAIAFDNASFSYPNGRTVLSGLNLIIRPGQKVAIVGPSGSGKSTIFRLVTSRYELTGGSLSIQGHEVSSLTQDNLFDFITLVPQAPRIFNRSLAENLTYGTTKDCEEASELLKRLGGREILGRVDMHTALGEQGIMLSGGEKQKIALCRGLLRETPILLLDESVSALDTDSRSQVFATLANRAADRTVVLITHRLEGLDTMDSIFFIEAGRVVEHGTHEELMKAGGRYKQTFDSSSEGLT